MLVAITTHHILVVQGHNGLDLANATIQLGWVILQNQQLLHLLHPQSLSIRCFQFHRWRDVHKAGFLRGQT